MQRHCSRLALKILHDVEKLVVDLGLVLELDLDGVEVAKGVCDVERTSILVRETRPWSGGLGHGGVVGGRGRPWLGRISGPSCVAGRLSRHARRAELLSRHALLISWSRWHLRQSTR